MLQVILISVLLAAPPESKPASLQPEWSRLERGYWLHASLAPRALRGYWTPDAPADSPPSNAQIRSAAGLLTGEYAANCLYLMYHHEITLEQFEQVIRAWKRACPANVEIVPTFVLRVYNKDQTQVFTPDELRRLARFCKEHINARYIGWYDVMPNRPQADDLAVLAEAFPRGIVRVGIQPDEQIDPRCALVVQDTWSGFCHGKTNEDWASPGFGRETLAGWIDFRRGSSAPVSWDLIVVAWDYRPTLRGEYPGYDDAAKNMPLPAGRNWMAARLVADRCQPRGLAGFSSDLWILEANSRNVAHDGRDRSFYQTLKRGEPYQGYYAVPFREVTAIYRHLRQGKALPAAPPTSASAPAEAR